MSAQTIAEQLRSLQAQIEQVSQNLSQVEDADLEFDIGIRLGEMRGQALVALTIAEGAAQAIDEDRQQAWMDATRYSCTQVPA